MSSRKKIQHALVRFHEQCLSQICFFLFDHKSDVLSILSCEGRERGGGQNISANSQIEMDYLQLMCDSISIFIATSINETIDKFFWNPFNRCYLLYALIVSSTKVGDGQDNRKAGYEKKYSKIFRDAAWRQVNDNDSNYSLCLHEITNLKCSGRKEEQPKHKIIEVNDNNCSDHGGGYFKMKAVDILYFVFLTSKMFEGVLIYNSAGTGRDCKPQRVPANWNLLMEFHTNLSFINTTSAVSTKSLSSSSFSLFVLEKNSARLFLLEHISDLTSMWDSAESGLSLIFDMLRHLMKSSAWRKKGMEKPAILSGEFSVF